MFYALSHRECLRLPTRLSRMGSDTRRDATRRDAKSKMEKETKEKNMAEEDINEADTERGSPALLHCCCPSILPLACGA